ncbi:acyl-CoA dehydrogenase [Phenylobacterium sp.]|uniref:acyl-CoA dehydrogenase family protein n=1 Tax=Phenylobacterium sp. TaxID=1871053 RepID=UPI002F4262E5
MQFIPTDEQVLLRDSVRRFVEREHAARVPSRLGHDDAIWAVFGEQGWLAAGLPEAVGGLGGGAYSTALIAEELGRGLVPEAFVPVAAVAGQLFHALAPEDERLQALMWGQSRPVLAHFEPEGRGDVRWVEARAVKDVDGYSLSGVKAAVLGGPAADVFLVTARTGDSDELTVFAVPPDAAGLRRRDYRTVDNRGASNLRLDEVKLAPDAVLGPVGGAAAAVERAIDHGLVAACAEAEGAMDVAFDMTRSYLNTRRQFGTLIGDFQALRHRLADMFIETEQARSIVLRALAALDGDGPERGRLASAAKVRVAQAGRYVTAQSIQLHGGIGLTEEYPVGQHFKRLTMFTLLNGADAAHLERFVRLGRAAEELSQTRDVGGKELEGARPC